MPIHFDTLPITFSMMIAESSFLRFGLYNNMKYNMKFVDVKKGEKSTKL